MLPLPGFLNPNLSWHSQFSPKILPSEWVWFYSSQQVYVTVKPGVLPRKLLVPEGWKTVGLENPAWKGAPGCKIRAWRLQQQHKYSSQAASQIPFTQWWSSDRHKVSVFSSFLSHLCISGYFYGMCFLRFLWLPLEFQLHQSTFPGRTLCRWHLGHLGVAFEERGPWSEGQWLEGM